MAGNLTKDPELSFTQSGIPVCKMGLAINRVRSKNDEVDFVDVTAWRELGETIANYKSKGDPILLEGRLQYRTWEAQDGSKRSKVDVVADNVQFLGGKPEGNGSGSAAGAAPKSGKQQVDLDESDFDEIPFRCQPNHHRIIQDIL